MTTVCSLSPIKSSSWRAIARPSHKGATAVEDYYNLFFMVKRNALMEECSFSFNFTSFKPLWDYFTAVIHDSERKLQYLKEYQVRQPAYLHGITRLAHERVAALRSQ